MPLLEKYPDPARFDSAKAGVLVVRRSGDFLNLGPVPTDMSFEGFTFVTGPASPEPAEVLELWSSPGASTVPPNFAIQLLEQHYVFRERDEVIGFLESRPFLVSLLLEARSKINAFFPEYPMVFLEALVDPEMPKDIQLIASIRTNLSPDETLKKLDSFDEGWWLQSMDKAQGELCIHVEFA